MHRPVSIFSLLAFCVAFTAVPARAQSVSLTTIAAQDGYVFRWLSTERSVSLYQPGLVVVLRPGETLYEVNDHVEYADVAPKAVQADLLVSPLLASRLGRLAAQVKPRYTPFSQVYHATGSGRFDLEARAADGIASIVVNGQAPSSAPVTVTLMADISADLPTIVVSRHDVQPDAQGRFGAILPLAPDFARGTVLRVVATSVSGGTPAEAKVVIGQPNAGIAPTFWDQFPKDPR